MVDSQIADELFAKLKTLNERLWEQRASKPTIERWLENFADAHGSNPDEQLHALYLLSQFVYFGDREVRELLKALYRDHYRYPIIEELRVSADDTLDAVAINDAFRLELAATRFLGIGNPSESGTHLLYYFRQENRLPKEVFASLADLFDRRLDDPEIDLADSNIRRIVFVDDLCGSGVQAISYSRKVLSVLRHLQERRGISLRLSYLVLVARTDALALILNSTEFDDVQAVLELDDSHRSLSEGSRHFQKVPAGISREFALQIAMTYGQTLVPAHPLGWSDGQLLLGFHHNVPDNTLPILWWDEDPSIWTPVFRRYPKIGS